MSHYKISEELIGEIKKINKLQVKFLDEAYASLTDEEKINFERYLEYCLALGRSIGFLAESYDLIVKDTLREQMYFRKHGRYRYATYAEVAGSVYLNDDYMKLYMFGLAITSFLWPNHAKMRSYFEAQLPQHTTGRYLEIGPGHGMYFMKAMKLSNYSFYEGIDISPTSVAMSNDVLSNGKFGSFSNYKVHLMDFLDMPADQKYDALVMGEVLEHVENPGHFLRKIKQITTPGAFIYITTCMNAPAIDHLSLFTSVEHLESIVTNSGLKVKDKLVVPYGTYSVEKSEELKLPVNIAMVLSH